MVWAVSGQNATVSDMRSSTITMTQQPRVPYALRDCADVTAVRLDVDARQFVVICSCGWRSPGAEHVQDAVIAWQGHRDRLL